MTRNQKRKQRNANRAWSRYIRRERRLTAKLNRAVYEASPLLNVMRGMMVIENSRQEMLELYPARSRKSQSHR